MRFPIQALIPLVMLLAAAIPATAAEGVRVVETRIIFPTAQPGTKGASHGLRLQIYALQGTRWQSGDIVMALWDAVPLLAQCGVALTAAELRILEAPARFHSFSTPVSQELLRGMTVTKPAIFFVQDTQSQPAYESESIGRENAKTRPELTDTIWVAFGAQDLPMVLAHELVHVLSDSGEHSNEPGNLMSPESAPTNVRLTDAQCQRLRTRGEANGLLQRQTK